MTLMADAQNSMLVRVLLHATSCLCACNATQRLPCACPCPCHAMPCPCIAVSGAQAVRHACMGLYPDSISCLAAPEPFVPSVRRVRSLLLLHTTQGFFNSRANIPLYRYRQLRGKLTGFSRYIIWTSNHEQAYTSLGMPACTTTRDNADESSTASICVLAGLVYLCAGDPRSLLQWQVRSGETRNANMSSLAYKRFAGLYTVGYTGAYMYKGQEESC